MKLVTNKCSCETGAGHGDVSAFRIVQNFVSKPYRRVSTNGTALLIVPVVMLRQAVVNGAFVASTELKPDDWNGVPVTVHHPETETGEFVSASDESIREGWAIGVIADAHMQQDRLRANAEIDIARAETVAPGLVAALESGEQIDVSTGYFAQWRNGSGTYNGKPYTITHHNLRPDHLALLPGDVGACSWGDGCGVRFNSAELEDMNMKDLIAAITGATDGTETKIADLIANSAAPFTKESETHLRAMGKSAIETLHATFIKKDDAMSKPTLETLKAAFPTLDDAALKRMVTASDQPAAAQPDPAKLAADKAAKEAADKVALDAAAAPLPTTVGALNALIANGVVAALATAMPAALAETQRPDLIAKVVAHTAHTKEAAEKMDTATLRVLVDGIKPAASAIRPANANYAGRALPVGNAGATDAAKKYGAMIPPVLSTVLNAQRTAAQKGAA